MAITFEESWSNGAEKAVSTSPSAFKTGTSGYTPVVVAACLMQRLNVISMSRVHLDIDITLPVLATIQGQDPVSRNLCKGLHNSAPSAAPRLWGFSFDSKPLDSIIHACTPAPLHNPPASAPEPAGRGTPSPSERLGLGLGGVGSVRPRAQLLGRTAQ